MSSGEHSRTGRSAVLMEMAAPGAEESHQGLKRWEGEGAGQPGRGANVAEPGPGEAQGREDTRVVHRPGGRKRAGWGGAGTEA